MSANTQYEVPTWNQIYDMLLDQAQKIQGDGYKPDIIIGIARGGLVPARILSDLLETPELAIIQIEYYVSIAQPRQEPILKQGISTPLTGKKLYSSMTSLTVAKACNLQKTICNNKAQKKSKQPPYTLNPKP